MVEPRLFVNFEAGVENLVRLKWLVDDAVVVPGLAVAFDARFAAAAATLMEVRCEFMFGLFRFEFLPYYTPIRLLSSPRLFIATEEAFAVEDTIGCMRFRSSFADGDLRRVLRRSVVAAVVFVVVPY